MFKQFFHGTAIGTVRDMKCVLNCCTTELQFITVHVAAAIEIQAEAALGQKIECFLPFVDVYLYEILFIGS